MTGFLSFSMQKLNLSELYAVENGECLEFDDTVVVMGDCRRGSSVRSAGNVIVLGRCGSSRQSE